MLAMFLSGLITAALAHAAGPQPPAVPVDPWEVTAIIEIPAGGEVKYERDSEGRIVVDRFLSMPVVYPANHGSVADTLAGDGEPLDILVYARQPIMTGARIAVRPTGVLRMTDSGEEDQKIIAVPASAVDPGYDAVHSAADLGRGERERLVAFFQVYKQDADGKTPVTLSGIGDAREADLLLRAVQVRASGQ